MSRPVFTIKLLAPRFWLTWVGFALWWIFTQFTPYKTQMFLGRKLGRVLGFLAKRRTAIAKRNLELCFSDVTESDRKELLARHLESVGVGVFELGIAWFWSRKRLAELVTYEGLEHLTEAARSHKGVLLMGMHFTHLDMGGIFSSMAFSLDASYRKHENPVYDWIQRQSRERFNSDNVVIERRDVRKMVRQLKKGRPIWYAPDQDYGPAHSIFVPFFGVQAATITATSQLARMGGALVIPFTCIRRPQGGYLYTVMPPIDDFPCTDELADTIKISTVVENAVKLAPEQYLWVHRRFKTRPEGEPDLYTQVGIARGKRQ